MNFTLLILDMALNIITNRYKKTNNTYLLLAISSIKDAISNITIYEDYEERNKK